LETPSGTYWTRNWRELDDRGDSRIAVREPGDDCSSIVESNNGEAGDETWPASFSLATVLREFMAYLGRLPITWALGVPPDSQAGHELNLCVVFLVISSGGSLIERV